MKNQSQDGGAGLNGLSGGRGLGGRFDSTETEAIFQSYINRCVDIIFTVDVEGTMTFLSPAFERHYGIPIGEALGKSFAGFIHSDDAPGCFEHLARVMTTGEGEASPPYRLRHKDGTWRWSQANGTRMSMPDGGLRYLGVARDYAGQKKVEGALQESDEKFHAFVDQSCDVIFTLDPQGVFSFVSPAWERHFGTSVDDVVGSPFVPFVHPDDVQGCVEHLARVLGADGSETSPPYRVRHGDGSWRWFQANGTRLASPSGEWQYMAVAHDITEQRRVETMLRENAERYRLLVRYSSDPIFAFRQDETYHYVNEAFAEAFGKTPDEIIGKTPHFIFTHDDAERRLALVRRVFQTGVSEEIENKVVTAAGEVRWYLTMADLVRSDEAGSQVVSCIAKDITQRKATEAALRESEMLLRDSQAVAHIGAYTTNLQAAADDPDTWSVSEEMYRIFGIDRSYPRTINGWLQIVHPDSREDLANYLQQVVSGLRRFDYQYRIVRINDGAERWVHGLGELDSDASGMPLRLYGTIQDITEQKEAERALRESEDRYRTIFEATPLALNITRGTDVLYANPGFLTLFGYKSLAELNSVPPLGLFVPEEQPHIAERMRLRREGQPVSDRYESECVRSDGTRFPVLMYFAAGSFIEGPGVVGFYLDLTERKLAEEQSLKLQAQLQQAQKMESLGLLAGGVAHDMNNVLGAIMGLASSLEELEPEGSHAKRAFGTILKAASRGAGLVKGLLTFARQSEPSENELDWNEIIREEAQILASTTLSKVRLVMELAPDLRAILGDGSALTHALMNLCVNAVDAMPEQGTLTFRTRNVGLDWVEIEVTDTGTGMPKDVVERALDPFFTTKDVGKGTGLGLSMAYSTTKAHGGRLDIQSEPGMGTSVRMLFPACDPEAARRDQCDALGTGREVGHGFAELPDQEGLTVLVVEDDPMVRESTVSVLGHLGHTVIAAKSGEEALAKLQEKFAPDLVVMDVNMPGLGGARTLPLLREMLPEVPVILVTGCADQDVMAMANAHARVTLLPKPFTIAAMERQLWMALNKG